MDWDLLYNDFRQKYEGCYCSVLLEGYKTSKIFYLEHVEKTSGAPLLHLQNKEFGQVILKYDDSKSDIEFKFPQIGLYNFYHNVVMIRRFYGRQWKKGICNGTISSRNIYLNIGPHFYNGDNDYLSEALVKTISHPTPEITLIEGINKLKEKVAVCLSLEFAIGWNPTNAPEHILWYYENPIGTVDPDTKHIILKEAQFKQEFKDFTSKIGGAYEFRVHS